MQIEQVIKLINQGIQAYLIEHEFTQTEQQVYDRDTEYGKNRISFTVKDYKPKFYVNFHISLRIDKIEDVANRFAPSTPEELKDTWTIIVDSGYLINGADHKYGRHYQVVSPEQVLDAVNEFVKFMNTTGEKFLIENGTAIAVDGLINEDPEDVNNPYQSNDFERTLQGITVAKMINRSDFEEVVEAHYRRLKKFKDPEYEEEFMKLSEYLREVEF